MAEQEAELLQAPRGRTQRGWARTGKGFLEAVGGLLSGGGHSVRVTAQAEAHRGDGVSFDLQRECAGEVRWRPGGSGSVHTL